MILPRIYGLIWRLNSLILISIPYFLLPTPYSLLPKIETLKDDF